MPVAFCDALGCCGVAWTVIHYQVMTHRPACGMLDLSPVHFRDQHMVS